MIRIFLDITFFLMIVSSFTLTAINGLSSLSLLLTIIFLVGLLVQQRKLLIYNLMFLPVSFMIYNILSLAWGGTSEETFKVVSAILFGIAIFIGLRTGNRVQILVWSLIVCAVANVVFSYNNISMFQADEESRVAGLFGNANDVAVFLSLAAFVIYFLSSKRTWLTKIMTFGLLMFVFIFTGSRQGLFLVVFIMTSIFLDFSGNLRGSLRHFRWPILVVVFIMLIGVFQVAMTYSDDIIVLKRLELFLEGNEKGSAKTRSFMIEKGIQLWQDSPLWGWGAGGFRSNAFFGAYSHNTFVEILVNYGLIGFSLFYGFFAIIFYEGLKSPNKSKASLGMQMVFMLFVLGMWAVLFRSKSGWLFLGIAAYCVSIRNLVAKPVQERIS